MEHGSSPTNYLGRTPIQIVGRLLFSVIILAAGRTRTSNQIVKESGSSPTSPPRRTYSSLASVSAETTFYWARHFRFSLARKFHFLVPLAPANSRHHEKAIEKSILRIFDRCDFSHSLGQQRPFLRSRNPALV